MHSPIPKPIAREVAIAILQALDEAVASAAYAVFGKDAHAWLSPLWAELAASIADYPFDPGHESLHTAPLLLRAGRWMDSSACIETIASWRRQPAPLAWMIEARCHLAGFDAILPLLIELAWMAPPRAQVLASRLELPALARLVRDFDAAFEGDGTPDDFAWFPAWALVADSRLGECLRLSQAGTNTRSEYCARIVLDLLLFECQGRHAELVEGRRKLGELHSALFARYMQARMGWARLLKRVFDLDLEHCPQCGGKFRISAVIEAPEVIARILTHVGLPARAPPRSPARHLALFQAA